MLRHPAPPCHAEASLPTRPPAPPFPPFPTPSPPPPRAVHFRNPDCPQLPRLAPRGAYGEDASYRWLAMTRLGRSLRACVDAAGGSAPWPTVANVALQVVRGCVE